MPSLQHLSDVCAILGLTNTTMAMRCLDADEFTLNLIEGSHRPTNMINESGLYALIVRSDKPSAKAFRKWVTSEVLPAIRKTGGYIPSKDKTPEEVLAHAVLVAQATIDRMKPKAEAYDAISNGEGLYTIKEVADILHTGEKTLTWVRLQQSHLYNLPLNLPCVPLSLST